MDTIEKELLLRDYLSDFVQKHCSTHEQAFVSLFAALKVQNSSALVDFNAKLKTANILNTKVCFLFIIMHIDCVHLQIDALKEQKAAEQRKAEEEEQKAQAKERERLERIKRDGFELYEPLGYKKDEYSFTHWPRVFIDTPSRELPTLKYDGPKLPPSDATRKNNAGVVLSKFGWFKDFSCKSVL